MASDQTGRPDLDAVRRLLGERLDLIDLISAMGELHHGADCSENVDGDGTDDCGADCDLVTVGAMNARLCEIDDILEGLAIRGGTDG